MFLFSLSYLLLTLLSLSTVAHSCRPSVWAVGLRGDQTLDNHLRIVGRPITVREHRLDINGYTTSIPDDNKALLEAIRKDPSVGFVVKVPQDYFQKFDQFIKVGWDEDDRDLYHHMLRPTYQWGRLQSRDPENIESGGSLDVHINLVTQFNPNSVSIVPELSKNTYYLKFKSEEQERKSLPMIRGDPRVEDIWPSRCYQNGIRDLIRIDGEDIQDGEDGCVFRLGYRQWYKEPIVTIPSKPSTMTLHPKIRSMRSEALKTYSQRRPQTPTPAPTVHSWEAKLAKDREEQVQRWMLEHEMWKKQARYHQSQQLQRLARMKDDDKRKGIRRDGACMRHGR
ncbi:uncharacterized protein M437DRAFT_68653 [Aureobasidium melanogenum CBS 110374]|uniref:Uncharacterized protein n=1 Tax=Aureobasidium melanogenum (strain CBS 110374) TaxID=1043003 RepID=A0A074VQT4_AURM1|nr:uncharacterized protein M437DRAFT_68653 [Aureobasidium melanogenum CBS 110374]KEQ60037.1 hypothetical protein M437DRAFT_68653 [Aureobasidium melanogenum CBS 110374]